MQFHIDLHSFKKKLHCVLRFLVLSHFKGLNAILNKTQNHNTTFWFSHPTCEWINTENFVKIQIHTFVENSKFCLYVSVSLSPLLTLLLIDAFSVPWFVDDQTSTPHVSGLSEETLSPGFIVDKAGAALYGLPPALAVQGLHTGFGHHHFGTGEADT